MKKNIAPIFFIILIFAAAGCGQDKTPVRPLRFVVVNEAALLDPKFGIKDYPRLRELVKNNRPAAGRNEPLADPQSADSFYSPAQNDLDDFLKILEIKHGLLILKIAKADRTGLLLALDPKFDITASLIAFFGEGSKTPVESLKIGVPAGKIAILNSGVFYDRENGIKRLVELREKFKTPREICANTPACREIGEAVQNYGLKKKYVFILDSALELPAEIKNSGAADVTADFIAEFNKNNK